MSKDNLTPELRNVLKTIKKDIIVKYPIDIIPIQYFIYAIMCDNKCTANKLLDKILFTDTRDKIKTSIEQDMESNKRSFVSGDPPYDRIYDECLNKLRANLDVVNSGDFLLSVFDNDVKTQNMFMDNGINKTQLEDALSMVNDKPKKLANTVAKTKTRVNANDSGETERELINLTAIAAKGMIPEAYGVDNIIRNKIFVALSRVSHNNVLLVGERGCGKSTITKHIANMLTNDDVPNSLLNRQLMVVEIPTLSFSSMPRHIFDAQFKAILKDANKRNQYIFLVDNLDSFFTDSRYVDTSTENILYMMLAMPNIPVICNVSYSVYTNYIESKGGLPNTTVIKIEQKTEDEVVEILKQSKVIYENLYNVSFTEEAIKKCVSLGKKYKTKNTLIATAADFLDVCGATKMITKPADKELAKLEINLGEIINERTLAAEDNDGDLYDELTKQEILIKSEIANRQKLLSLSTEPMVIDVKEVLEIIGDYTETPMSEISKEEREELKSLSNKIKEKVIGQDSAVEETSMAVKRHRVGLGNTGKPAVLLFVGDSGSGKTYLSKVLSNIVFGNDKSFVRLDMSEYSDKTSVNKLYGSSPGYIGYENGGILTSSIKKNGNCVLLLDEIEKASEDVHNALLQMFDEGRMTDNKGETVDFSNVIVIMTSNVGTKEALLRGKGVGFVNDEKLKSDIIKKSLKQKFRPEFINRIDSIVLFNKLTKENLDQIILLEINKLKERVKNINYDLDNGFIERAKELILEDMDYDEGMGARPILRILQHRVENKLTDYIIDNNPPAGTVFNESILD